MFAQFPHNFTFPWTWSHKLFLSFRRHWSPCFFTLTQENSKFTVVQPLVEQRWPQRWCVHFVDAPHKNLQTYSVFNAISLKFLNKYKIQIYNNLNFNLFDMSQIWWIRYNTWGPTKNLTWIWGLFYNMDKLLISR